MNLRSYHHEIKPKYSGGFSLLEMVVVLGLIAVLVTWITVTVSTVETEEKLRRASGAIISMASQARNIAVRQQRPYTVTLTEETLSMAPQFVRSEERYFDGSEDEDSRVVSHKDIKSSKKQDAEVTYEILRWRSKDWIELEEDKESSRVVLTIEPSGLVEPISIRCSIGKSWIIQEINPLTAGVRNEETSIEKE